MIREAAIIRRQIHACNETLRDCYSRTESAEEVTAAAERRQAAVTDSTADLGDAMEHVSGAIAEALESIGRRAANGDRPDGIQTGFPELDDKLGGLRDHYLTTIAARPSVGKTSIALNIIKNIASEGIPVAFFSLEQPRVDIANRLISMTTGIPMHKYTRGYHLDSDEVAMLADRAARLRQLPIHMDDSTGLSAARIARAVRRAIRKWGVKVVFVDYLGLLSPENPKDNKNLQIGTLALRLKQLARSTGVPVVMLAQLNREVENRGGDGRPRCSDLRDSGEVEQHSDQIILLHHKHAQDDPSEVWEIEAIIGKNRNGPTGVVPLNYRRQVMRFESK